jgi:hypothetical protein
MHMHAHRDLKMVHTQTPQPTAHSLNSTPGPGADLWPAPNRCTIAWMHPQHLGLEQIFGLLQIDAPLHGCTLNTWAWSRSLACSKSMHHCMDAPSTPGPGADLWPAPNRCTIAWMHPQHLGLEQIFGLHQIDAPLHGCTLNTWAWSRSLACSKSMHHCMDAPSTPGPGADLWPAPNRCTIAWMHPQHLGLEQIFGLLQIDAPLHGCTLNTWAWSRSLACSKSKHTLLVLHSVLLNHSLGFRA